MKKRNAWMDRARSFAILSVVLCHAVNKVYEFTRIHWNPHLPLWWTDRLILGTLGMLGVPLFLCLTGALMLGRDYSAEGAIGRFYKTRLLRLVACVTCWQAVNAVFLMWYNDLPMDWGRLFGAVAMLSQMQLGHMWYTPMIIGMYLTIPFVALALRGLKPKALDPVMIVSAIYCVGLPTVNATLENLMGRVGRSSVIDLQFAGGVYGLYIVCGYLIADRRVLQKIPTWCVAVFAVLCFWGTVTYQRLCYQYGPGYRAWYDFIGLMAAGLALFELFRRTENRDWPRLDRACRYLAQRSFAVFFIHELLLCAFDSWNLAALAGPSRIVQSLFLTALALMGSLAIIAVFGRIRWIRRILFYMGE